MNGLNEFKRYQNRYPMYVVLNAALSLLFIDYAEFYSAPQVEQWQRGGYLRKPQSFSVITSSAISWLNLGSIKVLGKWAIIIVLRMGVNQKSDWEHKVNLKNFLCPVVPAFRLVLCAFCAWRKQEKLWCKSLKSGGRGVFVLRIEILYKTEPYIAGFHSQLHSSWQ